MNKEKLFLAKLKALLKEYNADIQFACAPSSDTYGIYDGGILIRVDNKQVFRNHNWYIDSKEIKVTMAKKLEEMTPRELAIHEIFAHLDGIEENCEQMTSGNFMHNKNACKFSAMIIRNRLEAIGIKDIEEE